MAKRNDEEKLTYLINLFSQYLDKQHGPGSDYFEENAKILKEWGYFRTLLAQQPRKFDTIYHYFYQLQQKEEFRRQESKENLKALSPGKYFSQRMEKREEAGDRTERTEREREREREPSDRGEKGRTAQKYATGIRNELLQQLSKFESLVLNNNKQMGLSA